MRLFDSHAHLDMSDFERGEVAAMLERAFESRVVGIVAIAGATKPAEFEDTFEIASRIPRVWVGCGVHPHAAYHATPDTLDKVRFSLDRPKVVALGEIGLDYHYNFSPPQDQRRAFIAQLRLAHQARIPVVIHTRAADDDTLSILQDEGAEALGGVIHCFSSGAKLAEAALGLGFYLSFSGMVTFPKADEIRAVAKETPADRILAETDCPFLSPVPHRGKRNEPMRVAHVVEQLAKLRGIDVEEQAEQTVVNALRCFRITLPEH